MSNQVVANRYADALFQLAKERNSLETVTKELQLIKEVSELTPTLIQYLSHPKVTNEEKRAFITSNFSQTVSEATVNTLLLMIDRKRINSLIPMIDKFQSLANEESGKAEALVYSAKPLTETEKEQISTVFAKEVQKNELIVKNIVDEDLIGGIKIRIGDFIYDGSVQSQLEQMKRRLITAR